MTPHRDDSLSGHENCEQPEQTKRAPRTSREWERFETSNLALEQVEATQHNQRGKGGTEHHHPEPSLIPPERTHRAAELEAADR